MNVPKAKVADAGCSVTVLRKKGLGGEEGFQEDSVPSRIIRTEVGLRKGPGTELVFHIDELPSLAPLSAFSRSWKDFGSYTSTSVLNLQKIRGPTASWSS